MGETMSREQAAAKLVSMMVGDLSLHRSMSRSSAKDAAIGAVTDKAVDLILEVDTLRAQLTERDREIERLTAKLEEEKKGYAEWYGKRGEDGAPATWDDLQARLAAKDAEAAELRASLQAAREQALADRGFQTENARLKQELQAAIQRQGEYRTERDECLDLATKMRIERDAAIQRAEKAEEDSKTLNELGHALGRCYCTDSGCYTAEPEALMERAQELTAKERGEWDWDLMRRERDEAMTQLSDSQAREREAVERAESLAKNQAHIQERIQAALGNGADEQAWEPGEHWLMAACRGLSALAAAIQRAEDAEYVVANIVKVCDEAGFTSQPDWAVGEMASALAAARKALEEKEDAFLARLAEAMEHHPMGNGFDRHDWLDEFSAVLNGDSHE